MDMVALASRRSSFLVAVGWVEMEARGLCGRSPRLVTWEARKVRVPLRLGDDEAPHLLREKAADVVPRALALLVEAGAPVNLQANISET